MTTVKLPLKSNQVVAVPTPQVNPIIRTAYGPREREELFIPPETSTKQAFADECDINNIMARYTATGLIDYVTQYSPQYADVTGIDFHTSMTHVAKATELFEALPAEVRDDFENDVGNFVDFISDPANAETMVEMGLAARKDPPATTLQGGSGKPNSGDPGEPQGGKTGAPAPGKSGA